MRTNTTKNRTLAFILTALLAASAPSALAGEEQIGPIAPCNQTAQDCPPAPQPTPTSGAHDPETGETSDLTTVVVTTALQALQNFASLL